MKFTMRVGETETAIFCSELTKNCKKNVTPPDDFGVMTNDKAIVVLNTLCYGYTTEKGEIEPVKSTAKTYYWCGRFAEICRRANIPVKDPFYNGGVKR